MESPATTGAPHGLRVLHVDQVFALGEYRRCLLEVYSGEPTLEGFLLRNREIDDLVSRHPGRCAFVDFIEPSSKPPPSEVRPVAMQAIAKAGKNLSCVAAVLEGSNIRTALVRAVLAGMALLVPGRQPSKVFKGTTEVAAWVAPHVQEDNAEFKSGLVDALAYLRAQVRAQGQP